MNILRNFLILILFISCVTESKVDKPKEALSGEELSKAYCVSCHLYPEPELLDKETWANSILIRMGAFMGIYQDGKGYVSKMPDQWIEPGEGGRRVKAAKVYPDQAILTIEEWEKITQFYYDQAPEKLPKAKKKNIQLGSELFSTRPFIKTDEVSPLIQAVGYDAYHKQVYASVYNGGVYQFDTKGKITDHMNSNGLYVDIHADEDQFSLLDMSTRYASDNPTGSLKIANSFADMKISKLKTKIDGLMRPIHFSETENGYTVAEFGNLLGCLSVYNKKGEKYQKTELFPDDGSIRVEYVDMNQDGYKDILALHANSDEGIDLYLNDGNSNFIRERKLRFPPTNGSTHFQTIDFDADGDLDILYSNGDNGDYPPILKAYHGIHLYSNDGKGNFEETFFIQHHGVYQSEALDFDQDGNLDIASVSFHPDFNDPKESFLLHLNNGDNTFQAVTIPEYNASRWMRFMIADIDEDNDQDILLTAMNIKTPEVPGKVSAKWQQSDLPILLIENKKNP